MKVDVMKERILDINPKAEVETIACFYGPQTADRIDLTRFDYIADAIDTVSSKLFLVEQAHQLSIPLISCMGAGNKLDATRLEVADIFETSVCPLARVMRHELRARGIDRLKVVYSREQPMTPMEDACNSCKNGCICPPGTIRKCTDRRAVPGSVPFVPPVAGLIMAGEIIREMAQMAPPVKEGNDASERPA